MLTSKTELENKKRIVFAGTADFACPALINLHKHHDIIHVLTQPQKPAGRGLQLSTCPLDLCAQELGLPISRPLTLKDPAIKEFLISLDFDFLVVAAYGRIIPSWLLNLPKIAPLNIHGSILPRWRGASPIQQSILNQDKISGVTIIHMTPGLDEGPIYMLEEIGIEKSDTYLSLGEKLSSVGADLILKTIDSFPLIATPQAGEVTFAPLISKNDGQINWESSASMIEAQYRAYSPWPGLFSFFENSSRVKLNKLKTVDNHEGLSLQQPGMIKIFNQKLYVSTSNGFLEILELQVEGKKNIIIADALKDKNHWLYQIGLKFR
jgi:methionyl-tRNA formyltransferase